MFVDIIATVLTIIIGIVLISKYGLYGAIITALMGRILPMIFSLHIERKIMKQSFRNWVNWKYMGINFFISFGVAYNLFYGKRFY